MDCKRQFTVILILRLLLPELDYIFVLCDIVDTEMRLK